jgi:uncharacterized RDD family membrane protein YckC
LVGQPNTAPYWKQEVNRRLAAHKSRRGPFTTQPAAPAEVRLATGARAAQAAARVAARYAQAPSYSQMLAAEARTAVRAAEIATQVALEAQANAKAALAGYENAKTRRELDAPIHMPLPAPSPEPVAAPAELPAHRAAEQQPIQMHSAPKTQLVPVIHSRHPQPVEDPQPLEAEAFAIPADEWWRTAAMRREPAEADDRDHAGLESAELETREPAPQANLIEFPREMAAARKSNARHPDGIWAFHGDPESQLSIFEVDPGTVTIRAEAAEPVEPAFAQPMAAQPTAFDWSGIELDAEPVEDLPQEAAEPAPAAALELAPLSRRIMAAVVDATLIAGGLLAAALVAAVNVSQLPATKFIEIGAAAALFLAALLYHALFFTLAEATPGMKYARISLCTFDDRNPTRGQLQARLGALLLSVMPLGLGVLWAIFDEDHLSWHDRLSKTYQRRCAP